jgi:hypothetical protein
MAAQPLKFYLYDALVNSWQKLDETTTAAATTAGWIVSTGTTNRSKWASGTGSGTERAASTFDATTYPNGTIDNATLFDCWRTQNAYTGDFASANWTVQGAMRAVTDGGTATGVLYVRLFRSANTNGSSATEITGAAQASATSAAIATTADTNVTITFNPGAFSVTNEYLFFQIAWGRVGAGGMTTSDVHFRTGSASGTGSQIDTSAFTWVETTGETIALGFTDASTVQGSFSTVESVAINLTEASSISYTPRAALTAILTQFQNTVPMGKRYTSFARTGGGGPTTVDTSDTISLGMSDATSTLFAMLARNESLGLGFADDSRLIAYLRREETLAAILSDQSAVVTVFTTADTLGITIADAMTLLQAQTNRDETLSPGLSETTTILAALQREESLKVGLTEDRILLALLQREDTQTIGLTELSNLAVALSTSDTLALGVLDATSTIASFLNSNDTLVIVPSENRVLAVVVNRDDALACGLTDSSTVRVLFDTTDALQIIVSESSQVQQGGLVIVNTADTLVIGLIDAYSQLRALTDTNDSLSLNWQESANILARADRNESIPIGLSDTSQLAVAINSAGDTLTIGTTDSSRVYAMVTSSEAVSVILSESSSIFARLNTDDAIAVQVNDAVERILALLQRDDVPAVIVVDTGIPLLSVTTAEALGIQLTENGQAQQTFLNRLGAVLIATVQSLTTARMTSAVLNRLTVRSLVPFLTARVP